MLGANKLVSSANQGIREDAAPSEYCMRCPGSSGGKVSLQGTSVPGFSVAAATAAERQFSARQCSAVCWEAVRWAGSKGHMSFKRLTLRLV